MMKIYGMRIGMDLMLDGKSITRPGWIYNYAGMISDTQVGWTVDWDVPGDRSAAEHFRFSLMGTCLIDENFLWAQLGISTDDGQPITWRMPWQCYIQPYERGARKIPGSVDRITPGLWVGEPTKPETHRQRPLTLLSYVHGTVEGGQ